MIYMVVYMVVWSGGYDAPSYVLKHTYEAAKQQALDWWEDADENEDWIDVLEINLISFTVTRLEVKTA